MASIEYLNVWYVHDKQEQLHHPLRQIRAMQGRVCNEKTFVKLYSKLNEKIRVTQQTYVGSL